jgi:protein-L-isoaspartate(D-aspartate) O-methyltransferase
MLIFGFLLILGLVNPSKAQVQDRYVKLRQRMVKNQIEARGIRQPDVIQAMLKVERHRFVPVEFKHLAYEDYPLPIGEGQTISQPYIVALMTELLEPDSTKKILEIGTGSGYQAAILAEICDSVFTVEIFPALAECAEKLLRELGYSNISAICKDGYQGWAEHAPFDGIIVTCAPTHIPQPLQEQLAEGGKMIIPVGDHSVQELVLLTKIDGLIVTHEVIPVRFVPMIEEDGTPY